MIKPDHLIALTCNDCPKKNRCKIPCIFIDKLAGKGKGCREFIPPPEPPETNTDYKDVLIDYQEARELFRKKTIADIRQLQNTRIKAISALLYAGFKVSEIPFTIELLNIKRSRLYDIIRNNIKSDT